MSADQPTWPISDDDSRRLLSIASNQRALLLWFLAQIVLIATARLLSLSPAVYLVALGVVEAASVLFAVRLALSLFGVLWAVVCAAVLLSPVVAAGLRLAGNMVHSDVVELLSLAGLVAILVVNGRATQALKAKGIRVSLLGADPRDVAGKLSPPK